MRVEGGFDVYSTKIIVFDYAPFLDHVSGVLLNHYFLKK